VSGLSPSDERIINCRAGIRDFLPGAASGWDHLLMDQDDPEKRIADLEHQLAERMRGADLPPAPPRTWVSVDGGGFQQVGIPGGEARFGGQRPRRTVGWTGRVDVETVVVIGIVATVLVTMLIPSSALWTSGIVCNIPSHLSYSASLSAGHATSRTFQCVSGDSSYAASKLAIYALQALVSALVLFGTVAAGRCLAWLRRFAPTAMSESPSRRATGYRATPRIF
jgi:NADPH-dependent 2,4-dienoyl-CoA reductase/sulfur reductase-like enzyme